MSYREQITTYAYTPDAFCSIVLDATSNTMVPLQFRQEDGIYSTDTIEYFAMLLVFPEVRERVNYTRAESLVGMNILSPSIGDTDGEEEDDPTKHRIINYLCTCALANKTPHIFEEVDMPSSWYELIEELIGAPFPTVSKDMSTSDIFESSDAFEQLRQSSSHFRYLDDITNIYRSHVVMDLDVLVDMLQMCADADNLSVNEVELEGSYRPWRMHWLLESATEYAAGALAEIAIYFDKKVSYKRLLDLHRETVQLAQVERTGAFFPIEGSNIIA